MPKTAPKDIKNDILLIDAGDTSKNNPAINKINFLELTFKSKT